MWWIIINNLTIMFIGINLSLRSKQNLLIRHTLLLSRHLLKKRLAIFLSLPQNASQIDSGSLQARTIFKPYLRTPISSFLLLIQFPRLIKLVGYFREQDIQDHIRILAVLLTIWLGMLGCIVYGIYISFLDFDEIFHAFLKWTSFETPFGW